VKVSEKQKHEQKKNISTEFIKKKSGPPEYWILPFFGRQLVFVVDNALFFSHRIGVRFCCVFVNSALKIQYHVVKNTLPHTAFSVILPTGKFRKNGDSTYSLRLNLSCVKQKSARFGDIFKRFWWEKLLQIQNKVRFREKKKL